MGKTVRQLLSEIDSRELTEWQAYWNLQPFGEDVESWRAGTIAATVANCQSRKGRFKAQDFMPKVKRRVRQTADQIKRNLMAWVAVLSAGRGDGSDPGDAKGK